MVQAGADFSGVSTEMVSMNCTVKLTYRNTAAFFGVHVTSTPLDLSYSQLTVATGLVNQQRPHHFTNINCFMHFCLLSQWGIHLFILPKQIIIILYIYIYMVYFADTQVLSIKKEPKSIACDDERESHSVVWRRS